jgi:hypothetical protein
MIIDLQKNKKNFARIENFSHFLSDPIRQWKENGKGCIQNIDIFFHDDAVTSPQYSDIMKEASADSRCGNLLSADIRC